MDHLYSNIKNAYTLASLRHIGSSDCLTILMKPAYRSRVKQEPPVVKEIRMWPKKAFTSLYDCFKCTQWSIFHDAATSGDCIDQEEYTEAVLGYISKCLDDVTVKTTVKLHPTNKPWLTGEIQSLLKLCDAAFRSGDTEAYNRARNNMKKELERLREHMGKCCPVTSPKPRTQSAGRDSR